jgi:hypothetical protein
MTRCLLGTRTWPSALAVALVCTGCLKTLDESRIDEPQDAGSADSGSGGTGGTGGSGGTGGTGGTGASGGVVDSGMDAPGDAPTDAGIVPYDKSKYPVTNLATASEQSIIAVDDTDVFRTLFNVQQSKLYKHPVASGPGTEIPGVTLNRAQAMSAPPGVQFVFVAAGQLTAAGGNIYRVPKGGGTVDLIQPPEPVGLAKGVYAASNGFVYVSTAASATKIALLRFSQTAGTVNAESLYVADGNESGGDVIVTSGCVYWISNGDVWGIPEGGGARQPVLSTPILDAVGLTADATSIYYTRGKGELWRKKVVSSCGQGGDPETLIVSGFVNIGDVVTYEGTLAWTAMGDPSNFYAGGGVFATPVAGGPLIQIGPPEDGPIDIEPTLNEVVFATTSGIIRKVPKQPAN